MPRRSHVITMLPAHIRQEVERRLFNNDFGGYQGLAQWARGQGYSISEDSLWRYGYKLRQQLAAACLTALQTRARADFPTTYPDLPGASADDEARAPGLPDLGGQSRPAAESKAQTMGLAVGAL